MTKAVFVLHKRPGMGRDEFRRYWRDVHGPIAAKMPGLRKYVQNHPLPDAASGDPLCDGIAELWFDSAEALRAAFASPEGAATTADIPNFLDPDRVGEMVVEEVSVV
jgi:uncharacterized protein (TIGR02118 family)